jgi:transcriptional regulator with XRE-family HTH domain
MGMEAVAAYLREIRRGRGFTQESLAEAVDVSKRTIERMERNEGDITVHTFERIIAVLRASATQVNYLATTPSVTTGEAQAMAKDWLDSATAIETQALSEVAMLLKHSEKSAVARVVDELQHFEPDQLLDILLALSKILHSRRGQ